MAENTNEEELPILKKTSSGTYEKVYTSEDELPVLRPKQNAPSSQGVGSGAEQQISPLQSPSEKDLSLGSWTTEANPLATKNDIQVPLKQGVDNVQVDKIVQPKLKAAELGKGLDLFQEQANQLNQEYKANPTPELEAKMQQMAVDYKDTKEAYKKALFEENRLGGKIGKTKVEDESIASDLYNSFKAGSERLGAALANTPSFIYDAFALPQNIIAKYTGLNVGTSADQFAKENNIPKNEVAAAYTAAAEQTKAKIDEKYDKSITEYISDGNYGKATKMVANSVAESLPVTLSLMAGNWGGVTPLASTIGGSAVFGAEKKQQLDQENPNLDEATKTSNALSTGLFEGIFENFGITKLGGIAKEVFAKEGKKAAEEVAKQSFREVYTPLVKKYVGVGAGESLSEMEAQFADNVVDKYSGVKPNLDLRDGVIEAGLIGLASAGATTTPVAAVDVFTTKQARQKAKENATKIEAIQTDIANPAISDDVKETLSNEIGVLNTEMADLKEAENLETENLSIEQKEKIAENWRKIDAMEESLPTLSDDAKSIVQNKIKELETENDLLAKPEAEAGDNNVITETDGNKERREEEAQRNVLTPTTETAGVVEAAPIVENKEEIIVKTPNNDKKGENKETEMILEEQRMADKAKIISLKQEVGEVFSPKGTINEKLLQIGKFFQDKLGWKFEGKRKYPLYVSKENNRAEFDINGIEVNMGDGLTFRQMGGNHYPSFTPEELIDAYYDAKKIQENVNIQQPMGESKADVGAVGSVAKEELPKEEVKVEKSIIAEEVATENITPNETKNTESPADNRQVSEPSKVEGEVNEVGGNNEVKEYKRADEKYIAEGLDIREDEYDDFVIENSKDPLEFAETYIRDLEKPKDEKDYKHQMIDDFGITMTKQHYRKFGDINSLDFSTAKKYIRKDAIPLDKQLLELSTLAGVEITEADVMKYIDEQQKGRSSGKETPIKTKLKDKYRELFGSELTPQVARKLIQDDLKQQAKNYENFIEQESRNAIELEQQYYDAIARGEIIVTDAEGSNNAESDKKVQERQGEQKPPIDKEPPSGEKPNFKLDGEGKEKERSFTNKQFLADKSIPDNVKAAVTEDAIFYNELPNSVSVEVANKIYDLLGANEALNAILDETNGMSPVVRIVLGQVIIRRAKLQGGSKAEADIMLKAEAAIAKKGTEYGQAIQAFSLFQFLSKEGQIIYAKKQRQQEIDAKLKKDKKSVDARKKTVTDINEKVIDEVLEGKVGEVVEETTKIKPKTQSKNYGEKNKIVTKKRYEELKKSLKGKFFSSVIPPPELIELGVYHIEAGSRKFADFSKAMVDDLGTGVKKYLKDLYNKSKSDYESKGGDVSDFSNEEEISDVENQYQAEKLAKFIVNRAKQKKQSNDPAKQMISSLLAKVGEKLPKREVEKMSDIDKIALAIKNREEYADVWQRSKSEVTAQIDGLKIPKEEKHNLKVQLKKYYDEVIGQPFAQTTLNKAVKEGLNELGIDVKDVIRKHYTVADNAKRTLVDKLVMDANLSEADAKYLADKVEREFNRIATERKKTALDKLKKPKEKVSATKKKQVNQLEDEIIALSNLGAFADEDFLKIYAEKMGWEQISEEDLKTIGKLAEIVEKEQDGFRRARAVEDLLSFQAKMKGSNLGDIAMSLWYANVLSGPTTQLVNIVANTTNLALNYGMAATKSALTGNIKDIKGITKSMLIGFQRGLLEGFSTMQTGYSPIRGKIEVPNTLELVDFKRLMTPANAAKYVRRFMVAADVLTFEAAKEMRAYQLSRKLAREEGNNLPTKNQRQKALEIMGNTKEKVADAKAQAQLEYDARVKKINENPDLTVKEKADAIKTEKKDIKRRVFELIEQQRTKTSANIIPKSEEYARRLTYNYTPEGVMGLIAAGVNYITRFKPVKFIIPFTNIIANVANESLNYSPVGFARAATSQGSIGKAIDNMFGTNVVKGNENFDGDSDLRNEMIMKAAFGTLVTATIFALAGDSDDDEMEITADGYGNYKDNYSLTEKGWQPYSIRVGKKWISYQYTPLMPMLAFIGKIKDSQRYRKEKFNDNYMIKVASAAGSMIKTFFDSTFLSSMNTFLNAVFNENTENTMEDMIKGLSKTVNSFVLPNAYTQIAKEVERKMGVATKDMDDRYYAQILKDVPFARNIFQNKVNALGEDVIPDTDKFISDVKIIDPNVVNVNDLWVMLAKNKYPLRTQSYNQFNNDGIYDPIADKQRVITPKEYYNYMKVKGGTIKDFMIKNYADLKNLNEKDFAYVMEIVKEESTSISKMSIFPNYYEKEIAADIKQLNSMSIPTVISDRDKAAKKKEDKKNKKKDNP